MPYEDLDMDLTGKRAVITGASRGIGYAIAERFARAGAKLVLVSRRRESLEQAAAELQATYGADCLVVPANMSKGEEVGAIADRVAEAWGGVDILVNNAGTNPVYAELVDLEEAAWDKILDTNLRGPFILSRNCAKLMKNSGSGTIVNIASVGGIEPAPNLGAYSVSKAGLIHLTKCLARELGSHGVRVNCIAPGLVDTKFAEFLVNTPAIHDVVVGQTALGRHAQPEEIVGAAHYLASEASSFMTGQVMVIDGGGRL